MRILKIIHGYPPYYNAGSEVYSQSVVNELSRRHKVFVFSRLENPFERNFKVLQRKEENKEFYFMNFPHSKDGYNHKEFNKKFEEILQKINPDIAHIGHLNHLSTGIIDVLYKHKVPMLYTLHDYWLMCPRGQFLQRNFSENEFYEVCDGQENRKCAEKCYAMYWQNEEEKQYYINWVGRRMQHFKEIARKINLFHAPSRYLMQRYIRDFGIPENKIFYLDYGFPTHYLTPVAPKNNGVFTFGYIGRIIPAKGLHLLIEAFKKISLPAKLIIWGRMHGQIANAIQEMTKNSPNPIEFAGEYVNSNLATTVFSRVNCIVMPSIWAENSPLVIHEAQACKIPVITADYGGMKEYVKHLENGLLFKFRSEKDLYEKMLFALKNPELMPKLGARGYLYSENGEVPGIKSHCRQLESVYKQISCVNC